MGPPQPQSSESEVESSPVQMDLNAQYREDLILLLQQGLKDNGFPEFAERLMAESVSPRSVLFPVVPESLPATVVSAGAAARQPPFSRSIDRLGLAYALLVCAAKKC